MRADNTAPLIAAARRRSQQARRAAIAALRHMDKTGEPVNFEAVARKAGVSRSWLYTQPDLRADIQRLRETHRPETRAVPAQQRGSDNSLQLRLQIATDRVRQLEADNTLLHQALANALGEQRTPPRCDTPTT